MRPRPARDETVLGDTDTVTSEFRSTENSKMNLFASFVLVLQGRPGGEAPNLKESHNDFRRNKNCLLPVDPVSQPQRVGRRHRDWASFIPPPPVLPAALPLSSPSAALPSASVRSSSSEMMTLLPSLKAISTAQQTERPTTTGAAVARGRSGEKRAKKIRPMTRKTIPTPTSLCSLIALTLLHRVLQHNSK